MKTNQVMTRPMGQFKVIRDFSNYSISRDGVVYNNSTNRCLKAHKSPNGYLFVSLRRDGQTFQRLIHRLVAEVFIPNPNDYPCVDHIDGSRTNNDIGNLRWCTHKQNLTYPIATQRRIEAQKRCKDKVLESRSLKCSTNKQKPLMEFDLQGNYIRDWRSVREAARELGIDYSAIAKCCRGVYKSAHGHIWKYYPF